MDTNGVMVLYDGSVLAWVYDRYTHGVIRWDDDDHNNDDDDDDNDDNNDDDGDGGGEGDGDDDDEDDDIYIYILGPSILQVWSTI